MAHLPFPPSDLRSSRGTPAPSLYVSDKCLEILFPDEDSRPSLRSFREWQARRYFPHYKIGKRTFFDPVQVHAALSRRFIIHARPAP